MHVTVAILLALQCTLSFTIRVPITWNNENSEVNKNNQFSLEPQNVASSNRKPIPVQYFEYPAQKPKFAVDIAKFHGVQSPENHYQAYPVKPHTGVPKPELGKHQILDNDKTIFQPYQEYVKKNEALRIATPSISSYEVFHPYKLEEPGLKELYQDPVMKKIRNDLRYNKEKSQNLENEADQSDVLKSEYLEKPEETDRKKLPHRNVPTSYEIHRPQRQPVYYRPPSVHNEREQVLNQKLRHPWHQSHVKVKPVNYYPVKNHLLRLRQQHAIKYDDERNEYPQLPIPEKHSEPSEGYDIYEKGKAKFVQLRNNLDESVNEAVQENRPTENQQAKLELSDDEFDKVTDSSDDEDDFVPIKNYAQVRKTETTKHLPKEAAYHDADTLEEIQNAPRLREAIKSTKAQTVYSEEGYEDSAYDHAGEQKHASDHEEHRGLLKQKEHSGGKFKIPSVTDEHEGGDGSEYHDQILDGKNWKETMKNSEEETELEQFSEKEQENSDESDTYNQNSKNNENQDNEADNEANFDSREEEIVRIKREPIDVNSSNTEKSIHALKNVNLKYAINQERENINVPEHSVNTSNLTKKETLNKDNVNEKYPYYDNKFRGINKNSPLRYAENLRFIPNKSEGGTEFYDSRSKFYCPEVEDNIDPIPKKLKKVGHPDGDEELEYDDTEDSQETKKKRDSSALEETPRLKGLGDKIDCFKAKYFGENPLDSPFFKEEIISNPEPVTIPSIDIYRLKQAKQSIHKLNDKKRLRKAFKKDNSKNQFASNKNLNPKKTIQNLRYQQKNALPISAKTNTSYDQSVSLTSNSLQKSQDATEHIQNTTNHSLLQKESVQYLNKLRKKRAAPFVYEPYKIIRDSQIQDSKKTTTTNNISPLIKQLQSSRVVDKVATSTGKEHIVKRNAGTRSYKDIGKNDRELKVELKGSQPLFDASFVDVNIDQRRGEPRYELISANHKSQYLPVANKRSMSLEEYKTHTKSDINNAEEQNQSHNKRNSNRRRRTTTTRPYFHVSKFLPHEQSGKDHPSNGKVEKVTNQPTLTLLGESVEKVDSKEEYVDGEGDKGNVPKTKSMLTKTSSVTKIAAHILTTAEPKKEDDLSLTNAPKLRLVTRFRDYQTESPLIPKSTEIPTDSYEMKKKIRIPKYREKKKKISKSTLVTDTNSYGEDDDDDDDDDLSKEEVDALIGVKHDIKDYIPMYEKEDKEKDTLIDTQSESQEGNEEYDKDSHNYDDEEDEDDDDEDDYDEEEVEEDRDEETEIEEDSKIDVTTPVPAKITLVKTTEASIITTEAQSAKLEIKPVIVKKKVDIHKELPANKSSPRITEFKQDIKEIEIIKELPSGIKKKPQKNIEALEFYKDENLAKDINKLGGVEVFKEGLDLVNGPKHGGNYRTAEIITSDISPSSSSLRRTNINSSKGDVVASQSQNSKITELQSDPYSRRRSDIQRVKNNRNRSEKFIELSDSTERPTSRTMHGGNFKSIHDVRRRGGNRNAKLIELVDQTGREDHSTNKHDSNSRSYGSRGGGRHQMHGGNYRSAKLVEADSKDDKTRTQTDKDSSNNRRRTDSVLTTPLPYILDPSKRMYYYVEA